MSAELLQSISIGCLSLFLIIMLIHPKWRKKITEPHIYSSKRSFVSSLANLLEFIFYPILWIFKILKSLFH